MDLLRDPSVLTNIASAFMFLAVMLGVYSLAPQPEPDDEESDYVPLVHRGQMGAKRALLRETVPLYALTLPFVSGVGKVLSMLPIEGLRSSVRNKLVQAGNPGAYTPDEFFSFFIFCAALFPAIFSVALQQLDLPPDVMFAYLMLPAIIGLLFPLLWLNDRIRSRQRDISHALPFTLDMLTLSIEAGLDFITSIERIVTRRGNSGALSEEFYQMLQELKMGKTRREALRDMARRVGVDSLNSVVANLLQAEQLGTPLGPVLRIQSEMLRIKRSQAAEKAAMEASVKLLFPLLLMFASVFVIIMTPIVYQMQENFQLF